MTTTRPEVTGHLLAAGRELSLALAAVLEASAETFDRAATAHGERNPQPHTQAHPQASTQAHTHSATAHPAPSDPPRLRRIPVE